MLRLFKSVFDNVLLEHGGHPNVLPLAVHLEAFPFGFDFLGFVALAWDFSILLLLLTLR